MSGATTFGLLLPVGFCLLTLACGSSDLSPSPSAASSSSPREATCGTIDEIPFASQLTLPSDLPKGLRLAFACWSDRINIATLSYGSEDGKGKIIIAIHRAAESSPPSRDDESTIPLGDLVGSVTNEVDQNGTGFYTIQFDKDSLSYTITAELGSRNTVTEHDLRAVALSVAES